MACCLRFRVTEFPIAKDVESPGALELPQGIRQSENAATAENLSPHAGEALPVLSPHASASLPLLPDDVIHLLLLRLANDHASIKPLSCLSRRFRVICVPYLFQMTIWRPSDGKELLPGVFWKYIQ